MTISHMDQEHMESDNKAKLDEIVEKSLRNAAIWDELKDRLKKSALGLIWRTAAETMYRTSFSSRTRSFING